MAALVMLAGLGTSLTGGTAHAVQPAEVDQKPATGAETTEALQRSLRRLGWAPGPIDGIFGPRTEAALRRFQAAAGLAADGIAGPHTRRALRRALDSPLTRGAGYATPNGSAKVRALQRGLRRRGLRPGPVDGRFGPRTEAALARLQRAEGLRASGAVNAETRRVLAGGADRTPARPEPDSGRNAPDIAGTPLAMDAVTDGGTELPQLLGASALALLLGAALGVLVMNTRNGRRPAQPAAVGAGAASPPLPGPGRGTVTSAVRSDPLRAVGYVSIPKAGADAAESLDVQASRIEELCRRRGWELLHVVRDVENGHPKGLDRPGLQYALERIAAGEASCLIVSELERLSRSAADLGQIVDWFDERQSRLVAIDVRLDTASQSGRLTARTLRSVGKWEGRRIGEQTRKGLAAARASRGRTGRPAVEDIPDLKIRIAGMRESGMTLQAIADRLNEEGMPTLRGGSQWRPSSVQAAAGYRRPKKRARRMEGKPQGGTQ